MCYPSEPYRFTVPVTNTTDRHLELIGFETSCNCFSVEPAAHRFGPHETQTFVVTLSATGSELWRGRERSVRIDLKPILSQSTTTKWVLQGTVRPVLGTNLSAILFGDSNRANAPPLPRIVDVDARDATQLEVRVVPAIARADVQKSESGWRVVVSPDTTRAPGPFAAELHLVALNHDGVSIGTTVLPVQGVLGE